MDSCFVFSVTISKLSPKLPLQLHFLPGPSAGSPSSDLSHSKPHEWTIVPFTRAPGPQQSLQLEHTARLPWPEVTLNSWERSLNCQGDFFFFFAFGKFSRNHRCEGRNVAFTKCVRIKSWNAEERRPLTGAEGVRAESAGHQEGELLFSSRLFFIYKRK